MAGLDARQTQGDALECLQTETAVDHHALLPVILDRTFEGEL